MTENNDLFDGIEIPEQLLPENIASMLKNSTSVKNGVDLTNQKNINMNRNIKFHHKPSKLVVAIAACIILIVGSFSLWNSDLNSFLNTSSDDKASSKNELIQATDYSQVYNVFQKAYTSSNNMFGLKKVTESPNYEMATDDAALGEGDTNSGFSQTHSQVEGIDEADSIKTDGNRIYYIANGNFYIVEANNGQMTLLSKLENNEYYPTQMYLAENKVIIISDYTQFSGDAQLYRKEAMIDCVAFSSKTRVEVIDITDAANPVVSSSYMQDGNYVSSRMIDNFLYISTSYYPYHTDPIKDADDIESYIPSCYINGEQQYLKPEQINIPDDCESTNYTVLAGLDVNQQNPLVSVTSLLGYSGTIYCSENYYYVAQSNWDERGVNTSVSRFSIENANVTHSGYASIDGVVLNQFSMDEYDGYFRIATTKDGGFGSNSSSGVYVFDKDMQLVGSLTGIAKDEYIKSVRFEDALCYLVTFRQTDPLFKIDLSSPQNPKILSELKITGYSSYLINYGENKLLGFGVEADESGMQTGLKLSMFSTTDGEDVNEITSITLDDDLIYAYSPGLYDHKALLIDSEKNIIGIPVQIYNDITLCNRYYAFRYSDDAGFEQIGMIETFDISSSFSFDRGMFIGDTLYAFSQGRIVSAKTDDLSVISSLELVEATHSDEK